jgi:FkbM family methyltransferase
MIKEDFNWGLLHKSMVDTLKKEFSTSNLYETIYKVKEGDIVVDVGASVGIFTHVILPQKPKHVFCLEPSKNNFPFLVQNTLGHPVTPINKAIDKGNGISDWNEGGVYSDEGIYETITFSTFLKRFGIEYIDFLKTDCEGGEYHIFNDDNIDFLLNNVGCIVGEWHLGHYYEKPLFRQFRDKYLSKFKDVTVLSVDGIDITWDLYNEHFLDYYQQVILHISNK